MEVVPNREYLSWDNGYEMSEVVPNQVIPAASDFYKYFKKKKVSAQVKIVKYSESTFSEYID